MRDFSASPAGSCAGLGAERAQTDRPDRSSAVRHMNRERTERRTVDWVAKTRNRLVLRIAADQAALADPDADEGRKALARLRLAYDERELGFQHADLRAARRRRRRATTRRQRSQARQRRLAMPGHTSPSVVPRAARARGARARGAGRPATSRSSTPRSSDDDDPPRPPASARLRLAPPPRTDGGQVAEAVR